MGKEQAIETALSKVDKEAHHSDMELSISIQLLLTRTPTAIYPLLRMLQQTL